ncbi:MAG TPA: helicase C-terminal domain-containing protein, partial [bacterium]|nr:helicase C-terminal domain-containing protein [bacterium]
MNANILHKLHLDTFIALDTETTGLDPLQDDIIEVAAVKYVNGEPEGSLDLLLKPRNPISEEITRITGITNGMVEDAPTYQESHKDIKAFLGEHPLVAHNIEFDYGMLEAHYQRAGEAPPDNRLYDTLLLARTFTYWTLDHKLKTVARAFGVEEDASHRALPDAKMVGEIFLHLIEMMLAVKLDVLRQCTRILADIDVDTKPLFIDAVNYLIAANEPDGIGERTVRPPGRMNVYGTGDLKFDGMGEPLQPVDTYELTRYFTRDGVLGSKLTDFEERDAQAEMAEAVAESLNEAQFLVAEAGTGVGKSLAYLLPAVMWSLKNNDRGERIVISSNTKNLQEQLFYKDIPFLHDQLGFDFKAVLLKGRSNYLCKTKWTEFLQSLSRYSTEDRVSALPLVVWASETTTGDISENNGFSERGSPQLWSRLSSESGYCTTKRCVQYHGCYLGPLKKEASTAHLLLVNHSLLLADATTNHMSIPEYHHLIVDEAHNLEQNAYRYFASEYDLWSVRNATGPLYTRARTEYGLLVTLSTMIGQTGEDSLIQKFEPINQEATDALQQLEKQTEIFLTEFQQEASRKQRQFQYTEKVRYTLDSLPFESLGEPIEGLKEAFRNVLTSLKTLVQQLKEYIGSDIQDVDIIRQDIQFRYEELYTLAVTLKQVLEAKDSSQIYWYELPVSSRSLPRFVTTPIDVGMMMEQYIYDNLRSAIFTSATLKVADDFTYFLRRIGLDRLKEREVVTRDLGSPYYLSEQIMGCVTTWVERPGTREHSRQVAEMVREISERYRRGTLVLTTSYRSMDDMYGGMESFYKEMQIALLRQTRQISRTDLVEQFKGEPASVLLGTESFWEGVDVPGKSLEVLIIGKLPFAVPSDPIVEANTSAIDASGGNGFIDYNLPEAIIQFRQGFGRLIRSGTDAGVVIIADPRVATKYYGRYIAESLPIDLQACQSPEELFDLLDDWFRRN